MSNENDEPPAYGFELPLLLFGGFLVWAGIDRMSLKRRVQVVPAGRTARLVEEDGVLVSAGETPVDDDVVFALIDAGRT